VRLLVAGALLLVALAAGGLLLWRGGDPAGAPGLAASTAAPSPGQIRPSGVSAVPGTPAPSTPAVPPGATPDVIGAAAADDVAGFLTELGAIDPALVSDRDGALRAGQFTCRDLRAGKPYETVVRAMAAWFKAAEPKATLIVDAARNHLCPA
jgi:hypothetical protein